MIKGWFSYYEAHEKPRTFEQVLVHPPRAGAPRSNGMSFTLPPRLSLLEGRTKSCNVAGQLPRSLVRASRPGCPRLRSSRRSDDKGPSGRDRRGLSGRRRRSGQRTVEGADSLFSVKPILSAEWCPEEAYVYMYLIKLRNDPILDGRLPF